MIFANVNDQFMYFVNNILPVYNCL